MPGPGLRLRVLGPAFAVARLEAQESTPAWAQQSAFHTVSRTPTGGSVLCPWEDVPEDVRREGPFRAFEVEGPLDFALTGVLAALLAPLAEAGISVFVHSTFDTDYVLVRAERLDAASAALRAAGHAILLP
jgi:hypothetical protein